MTDDIITKIDEVTGCQQCGKPLGRSPSDDFCSELCQHRWAEKNADVVVPPFRGEASVLVSAVGWQSISEQISVHLGAAAQAFSDALRQIAVEHRWYGTAQDDHHLAG